ncbi:response regulator [Halopseudomonas sp.]|uniref:response regulator n=1 Tax=Halopseudomonas sp. TaxID=2901191 RepID=UPI003002E7AC
MMSERCLLIVDDNAATRYSIRRRLESHGYRVMEAGNGEAGLALIDAHPLDALILDINLPDMSGFDIARRLRADPRTALLPVIHVSAASIDTRDIISGLDAGADAYLIHPIDPDVLLATLGTLLRVRDTEHALREREEHFREIFENISAPIAVVDSSLTIHNRNQAFNRLALDCTGDELDDCMVEGQAETLDIVRATISARGRWSGPLKMLGEESDRVTQWQVAPYRAPDLSFIFIEDVTERLHKERTQEELLATVSHQLRAEVKERERTEAQLLHASKMDSLGKLTGGIAHDFNNLLTSVMMSLELVIERVNAGKYDQVQRYAEGALQSAKSGAALTHRLLAFARQQPLEAKSVDMNALVASLDDFIRRAIGENISLVLNLSSEPVIAHADASQLESAIINLVINARDAMPNGGEICISTQVLDVANDSELPDGRYVAARVRDNGTGIAPELLDKVFDPFFTTKPSGKGTGLGLSMLYGFAGQSGGVARMRSEVGQFTEVTLLLPVSEKMPQALEPEVRSASTPGGGHILIVDDILAVSAALRETLLDAGYRCTSAESAESALEILSADPSIDLLLTDIGLPRMNGNELAKAARSERPELPVLFMTGYAESAKNRENFREPGMDIMLKPFSMSELLTKASTLLAKP